MSVIVKGMKMPNECARVEDGEFVHCPFVNTDDDCILQSKVTGSWEDMYHNCPLVALPDHHGRLVDADAFKADYGMKDDCADCEKEMRGKVKACEYDRIYSKMDFCGWLDDAPTIVESEGENG